MHPLLCACACIALCGAVQRFPCAHQLQHAPVPHAQLQEELAEAADKAQNLEMKVGRVDAQYREKREVSMCVCDMVCQSRLGVACPRWTRSEISS